MTIKALNVNELLCDNNTVKTHHVNQSDFLKENLAFQTFFVKKLFLIPKKFLRISRQIKQGKHRQ